LAQALAIANSPSTHWVQELLPHLGMLSRFRARSCVSAVAQRCLQVHRQPVSYSGLGTGFIGISIAVPSCALTAHHLAARRSCANDTWAEPQAEKPWTTTESGLQFRDIIVGNGDAPTKGQTVLVHYTGRLENGKEFDSSIPRGQPLEFAVGKGQVIPGWDEGILSMRVGGKRQLKIPPELGYGRRGVGPIPGNATLLFDCELVGLGSKPLLNRIFGN